MKVQELNRIFIGIVLDNDYKLGELKEIGLDNILEDVGLSVIEEDMEEIGRLKDNVIHIKSGLVGKEREKLIWNLVAGYCLRERGDIIYSNDNTAGSIMLNKISNRLIE